jgi:hypothetical protein
MEKLTVELTKKQAEAILLCLETCLHLQAKSPNMAYAFGIDITTALRVQGAQAAMLKNIKKVEQ